MKTQTPKIVPATSKNRRKSPSITLAAETALAFNRALTAVLAHETAPRDKASMDFVRKAFANRLLLAASTAVLDAPAPIRAEWVWFKLEMRKMSEEEMTADMELHEATRRPRDTEIRFTDEEEANMARAITAQARQRGE